MKIKFLFRKPFSSPLKLLNHGNGMAKAQRSENRVAH